MTRKAATRRIHLTAVGSPAGKQMRMLGVRNVTQLIDMAQAAVGERYRVMADGPLIWAVENDAAGGRRDDSARVLAVDKIFADDEVAALVTVRGGAWFVRIMDRIDWDLLKHREKTLYIFGFSEMTPLIAVAARYPRVIGLYDLGPGFLYGGMERYAFKHVVRFGGERDMTLEERRAFAAGWAAAECKRAFAEFFQDVAAICDGQPSSRVPRGRLIAGRLPARKRITIVGGNLSLLVTLLGSRFRSTVDQPGTWLAIEEVNEPLDNVDRMFAALKLAGLWERAEGIILGDFHKDDTEQSEAVLKLMKHHLPADRSVPIIRLDNFGHIYPMAPLPMHREVTLRCRRRASGPPDVTIEIPWHQW